MHPNATIQTLQMTGLATSLAANGGLARGLVLQIDDGEDAGKSVHLGPRGIRVGAGGDNDLIVRDRAVSRHHAEIRATKGGAVVKDLGSTNGTHVAGARIQEAVVAPGGEFRVGETTIRIIDGGTPKVAPSTRDRFGGLIGQSRTMREVFAVLELASPTEATLLLEGPSGTGKEVTARAIHDHSPRAAGPFVVFDCGTVSKELITSALMGHKKGAFTGATNDRPGAFVEAEGGTLFLDELGELPLDCQTQLLRALESSQVTPVGGDKPRSINCRVVAATNRNLLDMVEAGKFRLDLFHRLAVVHIRLPALRERLDDLPILIRGFYDGRGMDPGPIDGDNVDVLRAHSFEGNVRELRNILERSWVLTSGDKEFRHLAIWLGPQLAQSTETKSALSVDVSLPFKDAKEHVVEKFEAEYLPKLMERFKENITHAANHAGLSRRHLRALLVKHGLRVPPE